jgi:hypothetical protein
VRLLLQGQDDSVVMLSDQLVLFVNNGTFSVVPFLSAGYSKADYYLVGAGGGGGAGAVGYGSFGVTTPSQYHGGGGGGGGGGGALRLALGVLLSAFAGNEAVVIGAGGAGWRSRR